MFLSVPSKQNCSSSRKNVDITMDLAWTLVVSMFDQCLMYTYCHMDGRMLIIELWLTLRSLPMFGQLSRVCYCESAD